MFQVVWRVWVYVLPLKCGCAGFFMIACIELSKLHFNARHIKLRTVEETRLATSYMAKLFWSWIRLNVQDTLESGFVSNSCFKSQSPPKKNKVSFGSFAVARSSLSVLLTDGYVHACQEFKHMSCMSQVEKSLKPSYCVLGLIYRQES